MKSTKIPLTLVPIEDDGYHIMADIKINGRKARLLVDTGASRSVFDRNRIRDFLGEADFLTEKNEQLSTGLGTTTMESESIILKKIKLGKLLIKDYKAVILDMGHVNESYGKLRIPSIDGVLGSDLLFQYNAVIDYKKKKILISEKK